MIAFLIMLQVFLALFAFIALDIAYSVYVSFKYNHPFTYSLRYLATKDMTKETYYWYNNYNRKFK